MPSRSEDGEVTIMGVGSVTVQATSTLANHTEKTATRTFTVKPKTLNVTAEPTSATKVYDGTKTVDVTLSLDGVVNGDTVTASYASAAAASADVENNKTVFVNGVTLSGADTGKYQLAAAEEHISGNYYKTGFECEKLHELPGVSYSYFNKLFNEKYGMPPVKYVTHLKIKRACELLIGGTFTVAQVSKMCGFENVYYFSNVFAKNMGMPPGKFKNMSALKSKEQ